MPNRAALAASQPVRAFGADGKPRRDRYSIEDAEALADRGQVQIYRNRHGVLTCMRFFSDASVPLTVRLKVGTRYSYRKATDDGQKFWQHKELPYGAIDASLEYAEPFEVVDDCVRAIFIAVLASCMAKNTQIDLTQFS